MLGSSSADSELHVVLGCLEQPVNDLVAPPTSVKFRIYRKVTKLAHLIIVVTDIKDQRSCTYDLAILLKNQANDVVIVDGFLDPPSVENLRIGVFLSVV